MFLYMVHFQPPTRSPQKTRQGETKNEDKEETEIVVRNKQETASRPPQSQKKSVVPSTVSRKVCIIHVCAKWPSPEWFDIWLIDRVARVF